jgi:hypothetical protein
MPADDTVVCEPVSSLEPAHRRLHRIVEKGRVLCCGWIQVAGYRQAVPEQVDPLGPVLFPQGGSGRDFGPSPVLLKVPVPREGILQPHIAGPGWAKFLEGFPDLVPVEGRLQEGSQVRRWAVRDPVGVPGFGIDAAR